jgi:hypothetical protein
MLPEMVALFGPAEGGHLGRVAGRLIGMQYYDEMVGLLGVTGNTPEDFATFMTRMGEVQGDRVIWEQKGAELVIRQQGWRLVRGLYPWRSLTLGTGCGKAPWRCITAISCWKCGAAKTWEIPLSNGACAGAATLWHSEFLRPSPQPLLPRSCTSGPNLTHPETPVQTGQRRDIPCFEGCAPEIPALKCRPFACPTRYPCLRSVYGDPESTYDG